MKEILYISFLLIIGCQSDQLTETVNLPNGIEYDDDFFQFALRMSQEETSIDNLIDMSNCVKVVLPVTITVNNQKITVASEADYKLVEKAINASTTDDDIINYSYPIQLKLKNSKILNILNSDQLNGRLKSCTDDGFKEIKCVKFKFPFTLYAYNKENRSSNSIEFLNNNMLYNYLENVSANDLLEVKFPVTLIYNDKESVFDNMYSMQEFIEDNVEKCVKNLVNSSFEKIITNGTWKVNRITNNRVRQNGNHSKWDITLKTDNSALAVNNIITPGTWSLETVPNNKMFLTLKFDNISSSGSIKELVELSKRWRVLEYSDRKVKLRFNNSTTTIIVILLRKV